MEGRGVETMVAPWRIVRDGDTAEEEYDALQTWRGNRDRVGERRPRRARACRGVEVGIAMAPARCC